MSKYAKVRFGRAYVLDFQAGDDLLTNVETFVAAEGLKNATFLAGAGDLINCHTHYADEAQKKEVHVYINDTPMELCGLQGFIEKGHGVHLHGVMGTEEQSRTVHIHEGCTVRNSFRLTAIELLD